MENNKQTAWLLIVIGIVLLSFVSGSAQSDVEDFWISKGLPNESASRISLGLATDKDVILATAIEDQEELEIELNKTGETKEPGIAGAIFLSILGLMALISIVVVIVFFVRRRQ